MITITANPTDFTPAQIEKVWRFNHEDGASRRLLDELETELGEKRTDRLIELVERDIIQVSDESDEPESEPEETDAPAEETETTEMPELLPSAKFPGYLLDAWGIPYRAPGPRRKAGKVKLENYLFREKGRKEVRHMSRYRLTVDGKQRCFYPRYLMRARIHAETDWQNRNSS